MMMMMMVAGYQRFGKTIDAVVHGCRSGYQKVPAGTWYGTATVLVCMVVRTISYLLLVLVVIITTTK